MTDPPPEAALPPADTGDVAALDDALEQALQNRNLQAAVLAPPGPGRA